MTAIACTPSVGTAPATEPSIIHRLSLAIMWLMVVLSAVVFTEPAPVDVLMLGLIILLPVVGLTRFTPQLLLLLFAWLLVAAAGYVSAMTAINMSRAVIHVSVTLFLCLGSILIAAFVMREPEKHTRLIYSAYIVAALIAAFAGIIGYFDAIPGAQELFTLFSRARGPFKDPNVFGPFLIPVILYCLTLWMDRRGLQTAWPATVIAICSFAILLSFSRGAWVNFLLSVAVFVYCAFITSPSNNHRIKLLGLAAAGLFGVIIVVVTALQFEQISSLMEERAALTHSYDVGPYGRFGGQAKAWELVLQNPLGIGAQEFVPRFHLEEPHNVYLVMFLNHGWLGGSLYIVLVLATILFGFRHAVAPTPVQPLFLVAFASFVGNAAEGPLIDTDHWRHFFLLFGILWGLMLSQQQASQAKAS